MINDNRYNVIKSYLINLLIFLVKSGLKEYLTSVTGFYYFLTLQYSINQNCCFTQRGTRVGPLIVYHVTLPISNDID